MRINRTKVKRRNKQILIRNRQKHRPINRRIPQISRHIGLDGLPTVLPRDLQRTVRDIQLRSPGHELGRAGLAGGCVAVVRADGFTGLVPGEVYLAAGPGERGCTVMGDGGGTVFAYLGGVEAGLVVRGLLEGVHAWFDGFVVGLAAVETGGVWLVVDGQGREVLPCKACLALGAMRDIRRQQRPRPRLRHANLKPYRHREQSLKLPEDHLLPRLSGNRLREQRRGLARIQMPQEPINARLPEARQLLAEVEEFGDGVVGVVVGTLFGGRAAQDVGEHGGVADFLVGHELD